MQFAYCKDLPTNFSKLNFWESVKSKHNLKVNPIYRTVLFFEIYKKGNVVI